MKRILKRDRSSRRRLSHKSYARAFLYAAAALAAWIFLYHIFGGSPRRIFIDDRKFSGEIKQAAARHGLDPKLVRALIYVESGFDDRAVGKAGEVGLMQVLPEGAAAEWSRVNRTPRPSVREMFHVRTNLDIGCWYLGSAMKRYSAYRHGTELALAEYNAGPSRIKPILPANPEDEVLSRITITSTRDYVQKIMKRYEKYRNEPYP